MKHIRELATRWQMRFKDAGRQPREVSFSFEKNTFSRRAIGELRDELRFLWKRGQWDPWSGRLPAAAEEPDAALEAAVKAYCDHKRELGLRGQKGGWNDVTFEDYSLRLNAWARAVGPRRPIGRLRAEDIERYVHAPDVAQETRKTRRRMLATFLRWLEDEAYGRGLTQLLPRPFTQRRRIPDYFTEPELGAICAAHVMLCNEEERERRPGARSPLGRLWMVDAWRVLFYQGLRRGELLACRAGGVDVEACRMFVGDATFIPKGKDEKVITITPPARPILARLVSGRGRGDRLFPAVDAGQLTRAFKAALLRAIENRDVPPEKAGLHLHDLRASCAAYWLNEGKVTIERVQELLRHKSIKTTEAFYRSLNVDAQTEAFEEAYDGAKPGSW